jgi:Fe-S cluster assembly protein SufD
MQARRVEALSNFEQLGMPSASEEVWRYSPIAELDLSRFEMARSEGAVLPELPGSLRADGVMLLEIVAGTVPPVELSRPGLQVQAASAHPEGPVLLGRILGSSDPIVALNDAQLRDALVIDVGRATVVDAPIVIVHHARTGASFPRTYVRLADGAVATVIEVILGAEPGTLSVPVTELELADGANLRYGSIQLLGETAWHLASVGARVGRDSTVSQFTAGLGAAYDRCRSDVSLEGQGASSVLRSTYLGTGAQVHDLRTKQDHRAPKTQSDLLCKGAVAGSSRSIYTGLIKVRRGAMRSEAMQTNHNLVLSEHAHADSVPNLDIEENDVRCSHASTVGPLDEDQRYYLESRGISPIEAQGLLVRGFFRDLFDKTSLPIVGELVGSTIERRLDVEVMA